MSWSGWRSVVPCCSFVLLLSFAGSCNSERPTDDLFGKARDVAAAGRNAGGTTSAGAAGHPATGGRRITGGATSGDAGDGGVAGASEARAVGGEAGARGGAVASGGQPGTGGVRGERGGAPASGGVAAAGGPSGGQAGGAPEPVAGEGGQAGHASGGETAAPGGAGGSDGTGGTAPVDCNDGDPCTVDAEDESGGCDHVPKVCPASACQAASCDAQTGTCSAAPLPDGTVCNDERVCTDSDVCSAGACTGSASDATASDATQRPIPDGEAACSEESELEPGEAVEIDFQVSALGDVRGVELTVNLRHPFAGDLVGYLVHVETDREALLFDEPDSGDARLNGQYVFADGEPAFSDALVPGELLAPGRYSAQDPLNELFDGVPAGGTWQLVVTDLCQIDQGVVRSSALRLRRRCPSP